MKQFITILFLGITTTLFSQQDYNTKKGYVAQGYDVVAYFQNQVVDGLLGLSGHRYCTQQKNNQKLLHHLLHFAPVATS